MSCLLPLRMVAATNVRNPVTGARIVAMHQSSLSQKLIDHGFLYEALNLDCEFIYVPCNKCTACKERYVRDWSIRLTHEKSFHDRSCFLTLTYSKESLPEGGNLLKRDVQLFLKRLRKRFKNDYVRFFCVGEYGSKTLRPHYHLIMFGVDFHKSRKVFRTVRKNKYYISSVLSELWPHGHHIIGTVTDRSVAYVARYVHKLHTKSGKMVDYGTHEKPFMTCSRREGIGKNWYKVYGKEEIYKDDVCRFNGFSHRPPRYYDACYKMDEPVHFAELVLQRKAVAEENAVDYFDLVHSYAIRLKTIDFSLKNKTRHYDDCFT